VRIQHERNGRESQCRDRKVDNIDENGIGVVYFVIICESEMLMGTALCRSRREEP